MKTKLRMAISALGLALVIAGYFAVFFVPIHGVDDPHGAKAAAFALVAAATLAIRIMQGSEPEILAMPTQVVAVGAAYSSGGEWMLSSTGEHVPAFYSIVWVAAGAVLASLVPLIMFRVIR